MQIPQHKGLLSSLSFTTVPSIVRSTQKVFKKYFLNEQSYVKRDNTPRIEPRSSQPVVVTTFCTRTPARCRQLMGKFMDGFVLEAELTVPPSGTCRGIIGMGVDCTGRTLATGFSSPFSVGCLQEKDKPTQSWQNSCRTSPDSKEKQGRTCRVWSTQTKTYGRTETEWQRVKSQRQSQMSIE